ncbi:MAG: amino acid adenylation domain-containing protein, partial [Cyanothece sp. SIO2G6]|nr:amino acid adenylation domain-containing protein [Cyanothece sp. SIO2G6]
LVNSTVAPVSEQMLHTLFAAQVKARGHEAAIIASQCTLTYKELYERSNQVGHKLRSLGVVPNQLVAVVMQKGWEQIVAVMGILAAGAAYVPVAWDLPEERRAYLLENSSATVVLTQSWLDQDLDWPAGLTRLCLDNQDLSNENCEPLESVQKPDDLAYVIYTSGSTGLPKGVAIAHRGVVNAITQTNQFFEIGESDRVLALTALHHDMSVYDIFGTLTAGGVLVIPDDSEARNPAHWSEWLLREQITVWNSVPAMMEMLLEYAGDRADMLPSSLRWVFLGGDWISVTLPSRLHRLVANAQVVSVGGPTETTLWNIWHPVESVAPDQKSIPYGRPIANTKYYVLNEALDDCPVWVPGELCCAGVGLAKGYWRDEEKTHAKFITHPRTGERLYRTGDMGRYLPDGNIEFLGRVDFQFKIRGYRIEPGEIEAALTQHTAVRSAVVSVIGEQDNRQQGERLVAYVLPEKELTLTIDELRSFLGDKLPSHMVPSAFILLDAFPLSANGKVDRQALPVPDSFLQNLDIAYVAPETDIEQKIADIWKSVLASEEVGVNSNFFEIGGNSLSITKVYSQLRSSLPNVIKQVPLTDLYKYPTIRTLADYLSATGSPQRSMAAVQSDKENEAKAADKLDKAKQRLKQQLQRSKKAVKTSKA